MATSDRPDRRRGARPGPGGAARSRPQQAGAGRRGGAAPLVLPEHLEAERLPRQERERRALFLERSARALGLDAAELTRRMQGEPAQSLRLNPLRPAPAAALSSLAPRLRAIAWCDHAWEILGDKRDLAAHPLVEDGHAFIQNASSLIPALALDVAPGQTILDLCAAPGGKTSHIAGLTGDRATLIANDPLPQRRVKLRAVLERLGVASAIVTDHPGEYADRFLRSAGPFDRILVDAQCSGEGLIDLSQPTAMRHWTPERITRYAFLQQKMLMAAWKLLKPGGLLVYSTCTLAPEENEGPVAHLLHHGQGAALEPVPIDVAEAIPALRQWQDRRFDDTLVLARRIPPQPWREGFFVARLRKSAAAG